MIIDFIAQHNVTIQDMKQVGLKYGYLNLLSYLTEFFIK